MPAQSVDVWFLNTSGLNTDFCNDLIPLLNDEEKIRVGRFHFQKDADQFVLAHAALQSLLKKRLGATSPLHFLKNKHGKPFLADGPLRFNLSHSQGCVLIAIASNQEVGIDVEKIQDDKDIVAIAERFFSPDEFQEIKSSEGTKRLLAFYACWARKEACLKAQGVGIANYLHSFTVSVNPADYENLSGIAIGGKTWFIQKLAVGPDHQAAIAVERSESLIHFRELNMIEVLKGL